MIRTTIAAGAMLLLPALPAAAQTQPPPLQAVPAAVDPARLALGIELAKLTNGDDVSRAQLNKLLSDTMPKALAANPDVAAMERKYPGIISAMIDAMKPLFEAHLAREMPKQLPVIGGIFAERMTADELRATIAFYQSPTGKRVVQLMSQESDFSVALNEAIADPESKVTQRGLSTGINAGLAALQRDLTPTEMAEVGRFEASPAGVKLRTALPVMQAAAVEMSNRPSPELDAQLQDAMLDVVAKFTGTRPKL